MSSVFLELLLVDEQMDSNYEANWNTFITKGQEVCSQKKKKRHCSVLCEIQASSQFYLRVLKTEKCYFKIN
jgi:hypothetical protein